MSCRKPDFNWVFFAFAFAGFSGVGEPSAPPSTSAFFGVSPSTSPVFDVSRLAVLSACGAFSTAAAVPAARAVAAAGGTASRVFKWNSSFARMVAAHGCAKPASQAARQPSMSPIFFRQFASFDHNTARWCPERPAPSNFSRAEPQASRARSCLPPENAVLPLAFSCMASSTTVRSLCSFSAVSRKSSPIVGSCNQGELCSASLQALTAVRPRMPSRSEGSAPPRSKAETNSKGSSPSGGILRPARASSQIHANATWSAVAPSLCFHVALARRSSSNIATGALPAARAVFIGGASTPSSPRSMSAPCSRSNAATSGVLDHAATCSRGLPNCGST
mmetsp:Transcript_83398/g.241346  ORF Transcript_83398/g.241346 Transcript_83398/m.241346 type:complete len:334 (+) Transcript_83398:224-1225(+)